MRQKYNAHLSDKRSMTNEALVAGVFALFGPGLQGPKDSDYIELKEMIDELYDRFVLKPALPGADDATST